MVCGTRLGKWGVACNLTCSSCVPDFTSLEAATKPNPNQVSRVDLEVLRCRSLQILPDRRARRPGG